MRLFLFVLLLVCGTAVSTTQPPLSELVHYVQTHTSEFPAELVANPTEANLREYFTPASVSVTAEDGSFEQNFKINKNPEALCLSCIVSAGKALWQIINDNKPVVNTTVDFAAALPQGITDWTQLEGWQDYNSPSYRFQFKNVVGMLLTEYDWLFTFKWGGSVNGTGQYVTQAGALTQKVYALSTEHVDVQATSFNPVNYGSTASPIGGIDLNVEMKSWGYFESTTVDCHAVVQGSGTFKIVACQNN